MSRSVSQHSYDIAIVGAGIIGLWLARFLTQKGMRVVLLEAEEGKNAASYGVLGALLPHMPTGWNSKKQFQFEALTALPTLLNELENETGIKTGYKRLGRISPVRKQGFLRQTLKYAEQAGEVWKISSEVSGFSRQAPGYFHEKSDKFSGWIAANTAPLGLSYETFSARLRPRDLIKALNASLNQAGISRRKNFKVVDFESDKGLVVSSRRETVRAGAMAITAGYGSFLLTRTLTGFEFGNGVKGQAVLLELEQDFSDMPIIYDNGLYIIPHEKRLCAIGSTSEMEWDEPGSTDQKINEMLVGAASLCPALKNFVIREKWAGVRPRCFAKDPLIDKIPDLPVYIATGGFKITLGIGHKMAEILAGKICDSKIHDALPESLSFAYHLENAKITK